MRKNHSGADEASALHSMMAARAMEADKTRLKKRKISDKEEEAEMKRKEEERKQMREKRKEKWDKMSEEEK